MIRRVIILLCIFVSFAKGQDWVNVFTAPTIVSSGFFFNEREGCIGTGRYEASTNVFIFYTRDGGASWIRSVLPNPVMVGQVTDIYFQSRQIGWATIKENDSRGWGGIYRTTDEGRSWQFWYQADFPVTIRDTKNGLFYTDRYQGIFRSTNGGITFTRVAQSTGALGLDFLDDNIGISSSEGTSQAPLYFTANGGLSWQSVDTEREAWTAYADHATNKLFYCSEHDFRGPSSLQSAIVSTDDDGASFTETTYTPDAISGGIAGARNGCRSVIYVQGQGSAFVVNALDGLLRSTNGGITWIPVGGPSNVNDSRFVVTSRGAVVYAFDRSGGVWKTINGGDGNLSASILPHLTLELLTPTDTITASVCDSAELHIRLRYNDCDSIRALQVLFDDEEIQFTFGSQYFGVDDTRFDTLRIRFLPKAAATRTETIRIRFLHPDGVYEDTTYTLIFRGLPTNDRPAITGIDAGRKMDFGTKSICGEDSLRLLTISNDGCLPMHITSLTAMGSAFSFVSSTNPFHLEAGETRQFLIRFKPTVVGTQSGAIYIQTNGVSDTITLAGVGIEGRRGLRIEQPTIHTTACDSTETVILVRNTSCSDVHVDSLLSSHPFLLLTDVRSTFIPSDSFIQVRVKLRTDIPDTYDRGVLVYSSIGAERFDTALSIRGTVGEGIPGISLSASSLDFGEVSLCSFKELPIIIESIGCDTLILSSDSLDGSVLDYSITRSIRSRSLIRHSLDTVVIRLTPQTQGIVSSTFRLRTNAGDFDIILQGVGVNDSGSLTLSSSTLPEVLLCKDTAFELFVTNGTCDSVFYDSLTVVGDIDFTILDIPTSLRRGEQIALEGIFAPQSEGNRTTVVTVYYHTSNGSPKTSTIQVAAIGIAPANIRLLLTPQTIQPMAGDIVDIAVSIEGISPVPVKTIAFVIETNSNIATPTDFQLDATVYPQAQASIFVIDAHHFRVTVTFTQGVILRNGLLGTLKTHITLSDSLGTEVILVSVNANDESVSSLCLPTAVDSSRVVIAVNPQCGDKILSDYLGGRLVSASLATIVPNPTLGMVQLYLHSSFSSLGGRITVFDGVGREVGRAVITPDDVRIGKKELRLEGASGIRFIKIQTALGSSVSSVRLVR